MSEIVVGVRLNADGSGLVGQLRLSAAEMDKLRTAQKGAADAARDLSSATGQASTSMGQGAGEVRKAAFSLSDLSEKSQAQVRAQKQAAEASTGLTRNLGLQRAGWQSVGFQAQDVFASYASGTRLSVIFAQQSGQLASAIAMIAQSAEGGKGKLAGLASFLGGPWGIAIGIAVSAGTALVATLFDADKAAQQAKLGANGLSDAQSVLGEIFDLTSGKIKEQNSHLILNARLMAINLRSEAALAKSSSSATIQASDDRSAVGTASAFFARTSQNPFDRVAQLDNRARSARSYLDAVANAGTDGDRKAAGQRALKFSETADFSGLSITAEEFRQAVVDQAASVAKTAIADAIDKSLDTGSLDSSLRRDSNRKPKKDNSAAKAAKEAERLAAFSASAAEAVERLNDEYNTAPRDIDRARQATAQIDKIVGDVNKRLETGKNLTAAQRAEFVRIKADAEALKPVIQDSLVRPIRDMLDGQQRQIELGRLQASGRQSEADALQLTWSLMDKMGVESEEQLATELAKRGVTRDQIVDLYGNLEVMRQQTREMRVQQQLQQMFLTAVGDMRENVRLTVEGLRKDGPKALEDFGKRFIDVFDRLFSEVVTEKLFGDFFRDLEDQITGGDKLSKAGDKMADAVDRAAKDIKQTSNDILGLGKAAASATAAMNGASADPASGTVGSIASGVMPGDQPGLPDIADIIVTGKKKSGFQDGYEGFFDELKGGFKDIFSDVFGDKGIFSESLGKTMGKLTAGAQTGAMAGSLVTGLLGVKGSSTGGAIGGAIGSAIAGPLGSIVGGTLGSVLGGLTKSTPKASATITGGGKEDVSVSGNKDALKKASVGLASSVQDTLAQIAEEFGGSVGKFAVSIGIRHGDYRVDTSGSGKTKVKSGAVDFNEDEAGAIAYAVMDAITDGGITGISQAIQKALGSSDDLDEAVAEALKVKEVEKLLGGLGEELKEQFGAFEKQAKERVRIATQYGFDVVAIEKRNAEDRAALVDQILSSRVGSLQTLLDDFKFGDLFEGTAADQRTALLAEIATTRTAADAGEDGAADRLAALLRQLTELSRDAFGTAGSEYATDRDSAVSAAEAVIKAENDRIRAAQDAVATTNSELKTISTLTNESNDLLSQIAASLAQLTGSQAITTSLPAYTDLVAIGK